MVLLQMRIYFLLIIFLKIVKNDTVWSILIVSIMIVMIISLIILTKVKTIITIIVTVITAILITI